MPYRSKKQQRYFHVLEQEGKISPKVVQEWDTATEEEPGGFSSLPLRAKKKKTADLIFKHSFVDSFTNTIKNIFRS